MIERGINALVVHCSATENGKWVTIEEIDRWHKARGFKRSPGWLELFNPTIEHCGYHRVIDRNGVVQAGRHFDEIGAHVQGSNAHSIGICMIGTDKFSYQQWLSLKWLVISVIRSIAEGKLKDRRIDTVEDAIRGAKDLDVKICGHRDFSPDKDGDGIVEEWEWLKTCPGFSVADWLKAGMTPPINQIA